MLCPNCGTEVQENENFCCVCGTSLQNAKTPEISASEKPVAPEQPVVQTQPVAPEQPVVQTQPVAPEQPVVQTQPVAPEQPIVSAQPAAPAQPVVSAQPASPEQPVVSAQPVAPEQPIVSAQPVVSEQPVVQTQPVAPEQPVVPIQPVIPAQAVDSAQQPKKNKKAAIIIPIVAGAVTLAIIIGIIGIALIGKASSTNFNKRFNYSGEWVTYASDGSYMEFDSNPYDYDDDSYLYYSNNYIVEVNNAVQEVNEELGFSSSVYEKMKHTSSLNGIVTEENDKYEVSWSYHPDRGLEVIYTKK